jgi:hypothetical protein
MSYAAVSTLTVRTPDGPLLYIDVPVEDMLDTAAAKLVMAWPGLTQAVLSQVDAYAQASMWPALRAEVERATAEAEAKTKATVARVAIGFGVGVAALVGLAFLTHRRPR